MVAVVVRYTNCQTPGCSGCSGCEKDAETFTNWNTLGCSGCSGCESHIKLIMHGQGDCMVVAVVALDAGVK